MIARLVFFLVVYSSIVGSHYWFTHKDFVEPLPELVVKPNPIKPKEPINQKDLKCLSDNLYYEAAGEGLKGMEAVATVVMNRLKDPRWPKTVCEVIYQPYQFSWTTQKGRTLVKPVSDPKSPAGQAQALATRTATRFLEATRYQPHRRTAAQPLGPNFQPTFFHSIRIPKPRWTKKLKQVAVVGNHVFYKLPEL